MPIISGTMAKSVEMVRQMRLTNAEFCFIKEKTDVLKHAAQGFGYSVEIQNDQIILCVDRLEYSVEIRILSDDNLTGLPAVIMSVRSSKLFQSLFLDEIADRECKEFFKNLFSIVAYA